MNHRTPLTSTLPPSDGCTNPDFFSRLFGKIPDPLPISPKDGLRDDPFEEVRQSLDRVPGSAQTLRDLLGRGDRPNLASSLPPRIIGIAGQKGHGKDLLGSLVVRADDRFERRAFADSLKTMAAEIFGLPVAVLHDPAAKEVAFEAPVWMDAYLPAMRVYLDLRLAEAGCEARNPRELLQRLGTEYVRKADPDYWVKNLMGRLEGDIVITDVRFENEAQAIRKAGGVVVRLVRDHQVQPAEHASEALSFRTDAVFFADSGDLPRLRSVADATLALVNGPRVGP